MFQTFDHQKASKLKQQKKQQSKKSKQLGLDPFEQINENDEDNNSCTSSAADDDEESEGGILETDDFMLDGGMHLMNNNMKVNCGIDEQRNKKNVGDCVTQVADQCIDLN